MDTLIPEQWRPFMPLIISFIYAITNGSIVHHTTRGAPCVETFSWGSPMAAIWLRSWRSC